MTHIHIIYDVDGWAYHRRALALARYAPSDIRISFGRYSQLTQDACKADLVYLMAYGACDRVRAHIGPSGLLLCGFNVGAGYRRERFEFLAKHANHVLFNNCDNWDYHKRPPNTSWISNGVDRSLFCVQNTMESRGPRAISTGSEYHFRHNDDLKGMNILRAIAPRLEESGIACDFRTVDSIHPAMTTDEMKNWYNTATVYVVASRCEGTPNPALEAAACGCTLAATRVGNMPELIEDGHNGILCERTKDSLYEAIVRASQNYADYSGAMQHSIAGWDWSIRSQQYYDLFYGLLSQHKRKR